MQLQKSSKPMSMSDQFDVIFKSIFFRFQMFSRLLELDCPPPGMTSFFTSDDLNMFASIGPEGVLLPVDLPGCLGVVSTFTELPSEKNPHEKKAGSISLFRSQIDL